MRSRWRPSSRPLGPRLTHCNLRHAERPDQVWRHKWQHRHALTEAEHRVAPDLPYFTSTERPDRLSETSRGNLFLLGADGTWRTPPLDESVLPGVTRREVLDLFADLGTPVRVERCLVTDLRSARSAFWTSSLSGAVSVDAVDGRSLAPAAALLDEVNGLLTIGSTRVRSGGSG